MAGIPWSEPEKEELRRLLETWPLIDVVGRWPRIATLRGWPKRTERGIRHRVSRDPLCQGPQTKGWPICSILATLGLSEYWRKRWIQEGLKTKRIGRKLWVTQRWLRRFALDHPELFSRFPNEKLIVFLPLGDIEVIKAAAPIRGRTTARPVANSWGEQFPSITHAAKASRVPTSEGSIRRHLNRGPDINGVRWFDAV